jgi:hypothetical protein
VPVDLVANVLDLEQTEAAFMKAGVTLQRGIQPSITYTWFNMEDPVVGGYTNDKTRCAARSAWANVDEEVRDSPGR